jgi:hypothetical protein
MHGDGRSWTRADKKAAGSPDGRSRAQSSYVALTLERTSRPSTASKTKEGWRLPFRALVPSLGGMSCWRGRGAICGHRKKDRGPEEGRSRTRGESCQVPRRTPLSPSPKAGRLRRSARLGRSGSQGAIAFLRRADPRAAKNVRSSRSGHRRRLARPSRVRKPRRRPAKRHPLRGRRIPRQDLPHRVVMAN